MSSRITCLVQTERASSSEALLAGTAARLDETCYLTKLIGGRVISVAWATTSDGLKAYVVPGLSQPLHAAASAKAILAFQSSSFVKISACRTFAEALYRYENKYRRCSR